MRRKYKTQRLYRIVQNTRPNDCTELYRIQDPTIVQNYTEYKTQRLYRIVQNKRPNDCTELYRIKDPKIVQNCTEYKTQRLYRIVQNTRPKDCTELYRIQDPTIVQNCTEYKTQRLYRIVQNTRPNDCQNCTEYKTQQLYRRYIIKQFEVKRLQTIAVLETKKCKNNTTLSKEAEFCAMGLETRGGVGGGRIILGDNTGSQHMLRPIVFQCVRIWIIYISSQSYVCSIPTCAKLDLIRIFRNLIIS